MIRMNTVENSISKLAYEGLKIEKLASLNGCEVILMALEKGHWFPEHRSPRDAMLVMLEGSINIVIKEKDIQIQKHQHFLFPADEKHKVFGNQNSKFLIVR